MQVLNIHHSPGRTIVPSLGLQQRVTKPFQTQNPSRSRPVRFEAKRKGKGNGSSHGAGGARKAPNGRGSPGLVEIEADGSDLWRLDAVADCLRSGGVRITNAVAPRQICVYHEHG